MESSAENLPLSKGKVLVVDDEPNIRMRLKELSEKLGYQVQTAADGVEGLECFKGFQPDLVVLDIYMPRMNGLAVLAKIKEISPACPVILITGFLHYEQLIQINNSIRPDGCIIKPLNCAGTADLMQRLIQKRSVNHRLETL
jgi:two-component system response regulator HydG